MRQSYKSNCSLGITKLRWLPGEFEEINRLHGDQGITKMSMVTSGVSSSPWEKTP